MLKSELAAKVQEKAHLKTKGEAEEAVNAVIAALKDALGQGEAISFMGFGTFKVVDRAGRKARNPRTGEEMSVPAKKAFVFKPSKTFISQLNK
ncbi:MAG: HU family DNA-binding protein [Desulfovibrio sp.]|nr:HU family DNA-binding protein [Desulfovibrio sp.]